MTEKANKLEQVLQEKEDLIKEMVLHMKSTDEAVSNQQMYIYA